MGPGGPALCPLCPATHSSPLGRIFPLKEFSFCDQEVTDAEPLVEGPELVTPRDLSGSPPPTGTAWMAPPTAPAWSPPGPLPDPRALPLTASVLLGPWPTLLQGGWGGASQHPLHFGAQIHSLWSMNICLDQKISIWSSASMSSPFIPAPSSHALHWNSVETHRPSPYSKAPTCPGPTLGAQPGAACPSPSSGCSPRSVGPSYPNLIPNGLPSGSSR